ncbi:MAG: hypothetical protein ACU83U_00755, partial [Gammaproteobacteria bacterium]
FTDEPCGVATAKPLYLCYALHFYSADTGARCAIIDATLYRKFVIFSLERTSATIAPIDLDRFHNLIRRSIWEIVHALNR